MFMIFFHHSQQTLSIFLVGTQRLSTETALNVRNLFEIRFLLIYKKKIIFSYSEKYIKVT